MNIKTINPNVHLVISDQNWLESSALDQLKQTATLPGMQCCVGMPDLHPGRGQPIGAAFISKDIIYPHLVGSDVGCGMGLWLLDTPIQKVKLDKWEKRLVGLDDEWVGDSTEWFEEKGLLSSEFNLPQATGKLGTIGGGNHFAELQAVHEVFDSSRFSSEGLTNQAVVLVVHSGSRGLGQTILHDHTTSHSGEGLTKGTALENCEFTRYLQRHDVAVKWAEVNRELIAHRFCERLGTQGRSLLDVTHNFVERLHSESASLMKLSAQADEKYWIHRKGATPANRGLVVIPGSRGSLSYLVAPRTDNIQQLALAAFSLAHGAGRKWSRGEARGRLEKRFQLKDLLRTSLGSRVICEQRNLLYEEAPQAYKNIDLVVNDLVEVELINVVASFKPLLTYKTRRS